MFTALNKKFHRQQGKFFENAARQFLEKQGMRFVDANVMFKGGELDLIMLDGDTFVFVEVRQRSNTQFGSAIDSVDSNKQKNWLHAAELWLAQYEFSLEDANCRFDLIAFGKDTKDIQWLPNFLDD